MDNEALWSSLSVASPSKCRRAPFPVVATDQIVIRNSAVGVDPLDLKLLQVFEKYGKGPVVLGQSVAGVVVRVGRDVSRFRKGQSVMALCLPAGGATAVGGAFQRYASTSEALTIEIPESMSFEQAAVLPLPISLAAAGLYQRNHLDLPLPGTRDDRSGQKVLVVDATSQVGAMAVQLAIASNLTVIATAAREDHAWVKSLGVTVVFDLSPTFAQSQLNEVVCDHSLLGIFDATATDHTSSELSTAFAQTEAQPRMCAVWPTTAVPKRVSSSIGKYTITCKQEKMQEG